MKHARFGILIFVEFLLLSLAIGFWLSTLPGAYGPPATSPGQQIVIVPTGPSRVLGAEQYNYELDRHERGLDSAFD